MKKAAHIPMMVFEILPSVVLGMAVLVALALLQFLQVVPRNERRVFINRWTGRIVIKDAYWNLIFPHLRPVPNRLFPSYEHFPAPEARAFTLDPPRVDLQSKDGVPATVDVQATLHILPYIAPDLERLGNESVEKQAKIVINAWITNRLSALTSTELRDYASVQRFINSSESIASLDKELQPFLLRTKQLFIDYNGIQLSSDYQTTIGARIKLEGQAALKEIEAQNRLRTATTDAEILKITVESECAARERRIQSATEGFAILMKGGVAKEDAVRLLAADRLAEAIEKTSAATNLLLPATLMDSSVAKLAQ